jgi:hypothetical protein
MTRARRRARAALLALRATLAVLGGDNGRG